MFAVYSRELFRCPSSVSGKLGAKDTIACLSFLCRLEYAEYSRLFWRTCPELKYRSSVYVRIFEGVENGSATLCPPLLASGPLICYQCSFGGYESAEKMVRLLDVFLTDFAYPPFRGRKPRGPRLPTSERSSVEDVS